MTEGASGQMSGDEYSNEIVAIVDDEAQVRETLETLLASVSINVRLFESGPDFLSSFTVDGPGCVLVDVRMPKMNGLEVLRAIQKNGIGLPVIIMTGHADVELAVNAFREGAFDFIEKPFSANGVIDLVQRALKSSRSQFEAASEAEKIRSHLDTLSEREKEVLALLVAGASSKEVGRALTISHRTAEHHRKSIMQKMGVGSVVELAKFMATMESS